MKKTKFKFNYKFIIILLVIIVFIGLVVGGILLKKKSQSPRDLTKDYFESYKKLDNNIVKEIQYDFDDKLTKDQFRRYKDIIESQYLGLQYNIVDVISDDSNAHVNVEIIVNDLKSTMDKSNSYIEVYSDKFTKNDKFDEYAAIDYKIDQLEDTTLKIDYTLSLEFYKKNGKWVLSDLNDYDKKKINGTY